MGNRWLLVTTVSSRLLGDHDHIAPFQHITSNQAATVLFRNVAFIACCSRPPRSPSIVIMFAWSRCVECQLFLRLNFAELDRYSAAGVRSVAFNLSWNCSAVLSCHLSFFVRAEGTVSLKLSSFNNIYGRKERFISCCKSCCDHGC